MPANNKQIQQRERFLNLYFDGPTEVRGNFKASLRGAGYSSTSITFKQGKFRRYVVDEARRRGLPSSRFEKPAARTEKMPGVSWSPLSGRTYREGPRSEPTEQRQPAPKNPVAFVEQREQEGWIRTGNGTRLPTWVIGYNAQDLASQRQGQFRADSYRNVRRDLNGNLVVSD